MFQWFSRLRPAGPGEKKKEAEHKSSIANNFNGICTIRYLKLLGPRKDSVRLP